MERNFETFILVFLFIVVCVFVCVCVCVYVCVCVCVRIFSFWGGTVGRRDSCDISLLASSSAILLSSLSLSLVAC